MQCFTLREQALPWLRGVLDEDGDPVISTPEGCDVLVVLGKEFTQQLTEATTVFPGVTGFRLGFNCDAHKRMAPQDRRVGVECEFAENTLILKPAPRRYSRRDKEQALVRIETVGGAGGKVRLHGSVPTQELKNGRVLETFEPFPPVGVVPLCDEATQKRVNLGVEVLDLFVLMQPGARFRVHRTGDVADGARNIPVCWTGKELYPIHPTYDMKKPQEGIFKPFGGRTSAVFY